MLMNLRTQVLVEHVGVVTLLLRLLLLPRLLLLILLRIDFVLFIVSMLGVVHTWNSFQA